MSTQRVTLQAIAHQAVESFKTLAHVRRSCRQIDPGRWTKAEHRLHPLQYENQTLQRGSVESRPHFDPTPMRKHYGQAAIAIPLQPAADHLHGNQTRLSRRAGGFLSLLEMAIQRTRANLFASTELNFR